MTNANQISSKWTRRMAGWMAVFGCAAFPAYAADPIGEVASVEGSIEAISADGDRRVLSRGDAIYAGDRVTADPGESAGFWFDSVLGQLDGDSRALITGTPDGRTRIELERGAVRVIDPREDGMGNAIELMALGALAQISGGDAEARILREKTGPYAVMCDWNHPIRVTRNGRGLGNRGAAESASAAAPGDCVVANGRESLFGSPGHAERIALLGGGGPGLGDAGPGMALADLVGEPGGLLPAVGAGGGLGAGGAGGNDGLRQLGVAGLPLALRSPCGALGGTCVGGSAGTTTPPTTVIEPPPSTTPFPGSN